MKNEIREAYERMNPPRDAKERMMKNIMKKQNKGRTYYTAAPGPERWWTAIPAALALVAVLVIGWQFLFPNAEGPMTDDPTPTETAQMIERDIINLDELFPDVPEQYLDILGKYYEALAFDYGSKEWESFGLNLTAYENLDVIEDLGYTLMDLDGNGQEELLITDGDQVYDLYVEVDGEVRELLAGRIDAQGKRNSIKLCQDNTFMIWQRSSGVDFLHWRRLGRDGLGTIALVCEKTVSGGDDGKWYAGPNDKDAVPVSEEEAREIMNSRDPVFVNYTSICPEKFAMNPDVMPAGYADVIGKYIRAYEEDWSVEEYMQSDICYVLGMQDSIWEYGYALIDLDGNGIVELIITDGSLIYDMFTLMEDGGVGHIISAGERSRYYLCEGNIIGYRGSGGAANTVLEFYKLENQDLVPKTRLMFDTDSWYQLSDKGTETPGGIQYITEEEAEKIAASYAPVEIVSQSFLRPETENTNDTSRPLPGDYPHVIEKYIKATTDEWSKDEYRKNDISYLLESMNIYWEYGYAQIDLNGDGRNELVITDGEEIFDVYMLMDDGSVGHIISATEERSYYLCRDNIIGCQSLGVENTSWDFSRLLPSGDSEIVMYLQKDADGWLKMEGSTDKMVTISHNEADEIISTYWHIEIPFQTILPPEQEKELKYPRTYVQMLREMMGEYSGIATMHVALTDVTGDGEEELLLGFQGNDSFGHVYSIVDGETKEILTYGRDIDFTLCKDGIICFHESDNSYGDYSFIRLRGNGNHVIDYLLYDSRNNSWSQEKNGVRELITDTEMQEILDSYGCVYLEWIPVREVIAG